MDITDIGRFPCDGPEGRATGRFFKIAAANRLKTIFGKDHPIKIDLFVSNDVVHMGELFIPSGGVGSRASEVNRCRGDVCFYVRTGPMTFFLPESKEVFHVGEGRTLFLPEDTPYQIINYNGRVSCAIFAMAPGI